MVNWLLKFVSNKKMKDGIEVIILINCHLFDCPFGSVMGFTMVCVGSGHFLEEIVFAFGLS